MDRSSLKISIDEWQQSYRNSRATLIQRFAYDLPPNNFARAFVGVRRCGKTYSAIQSSLALGVEEVLYYNFEDPIFISEPQVENLDLLLSVAIEYSKAPLRLLILDEIQNVLGWERWLRKLIDQKRYQIVVTGSSAKMLSSEISTALTGRVLQENIWPLSYEEYLAFCKYPTPTTLDAHRAPFSNYLAWGGFPEAALISSNEIRRKLLRQYLDDIVLKDVISRHEIRNKRALDIVLMYYLTNLSSLHSTSAIKKAFGLSLDLVDQYTSALAEAFAIFEVSRFHPNLKVQSRDARKIYVIDTGLRNAGSRSPQDDTGKLLENVIFIELKRRGLDIFYFKGTTEVDFIVTERGKPVAAIQVCASDLREPKTYQREIGALEECLSALKLTSGLIITLDRDESIKLDTGATIRFIPATTWLTQKRSE